MKVYSSNNVDILPKDYTHIGYSHSLKTVSTVSLSSKNFIKNVVDMLISLKIYISLGFIKTIFGN